MDSYDFVHLALLAEGGEIKGKTKLQKTVYFLGVITGCLKDLGYRPHFYGPYSDDVAEAIDRLKSVGFVDQNRVSCYGLDQLGFERFRYDYRLNEVGRTVAEAKRRKHPTLWKRLTQGAQLLGQAGNLDYMKLSIAAKTYFLLGQKKGPATEQELAGLAVRFGWSVTPEQVKEAGSFLQKVGLVELTTN